jgi:deoxyadenosine/deoxycytidine kinase
MSPQVYSVLVEGNIASGKSTFLKKVERTLLDQAKVTYEPLDQWTSFKGLNLLKELYLNPKRFSFQFQTFVQLTMARIQLQETTDKFRFSERSLFSERFVFIEALKALQHISPTEYDILVEWFEFLEPKIQPVNELIYLRTTPAVAFRRLQSRGRNEEAPVTIEYIELIHSLHEQWLIEKTLPTSENFKKITVRIVNQDKTLDELKPEFESIICDICEINV